MTLEDLIAQIARLPLHNGRRLVAIAGPPASGKSTLADHLAARIEGACAVPMDGFHRDNTDLIAQGLLERKGAPQTFDAVGFCALIAEIARGGQVSYPTFDRSRDQTVPAGGQVAANAQTVIVEGNYLLLADSPWDQLGRFWGLSVMVAPPVAVLEQRLVQRWVDHGMSPQAARMRAMGNDIPNARLVLDRSVDATIRTTGFDI